MKKLLSLLLVLSLLIAPVAVVGAAGPAMLISASPVNLMVDGEKITADQGAVYDAKMDTYMLPLRAVAEAIGADITWDEPSRTAGLKYMNKQIQVPLETTHAFLNGERIDLGVANRIMNERTMVTSDFFAKVLGSKVNIDKANNSLAINDRNVKLKLSSTIGPVDAGIVGLLAETFEANTGIEVEYNAAGTGKTIELSKSGDFDIVMVHAESLELQFIADGYGTERIPVMYNDFVIIGPTADPAGIKGMDLAEGLKTIADKEIHFISRGDMSGTHVKEAELWEWVGIDVEAAGDWYEVWVDGDKGNSATLKYTDAEEAYTMIDRATFLSLQDEIAIRPLIEGDEILLNFISVIPISKATFPNINHQAAAMFAEFIAGEEAQTLIRDFKVDVYGQPLFFPNSNEWHALQLEQAS